MPYPKFGHKNLRKGRLSFPGASYFVTFRAADEHPVLLEPTVATIIIDTFLSLEKEGSLVAKCCIVMPDHLHAVFILGSGTIGSVVRIWKGRTARRINELLGRSGSFWVKEFYEHRVRTDERLSEIVKYCYENPIRKGLVLRSRDWPFWWSAWEME